MPAWWRPRRWPRTHREDNIHLIVNGRPVRDTLLTQALTRGLPPAAAPRPVPAGVLVLTMVPPAAGRERPPHQGLGALPPAPAVHDLVHDGGRAGAPARSTRCRRPGSRGSGLPDLGDRGVRRWAADPGGSGPQGPGRRCSATRRPRTTRPPVLRAADRPDRGHVHRRLHGRRGVLHRPARGPRARAVRAACERARPRRPAGRPGAALSPAAGAGPGPAAGARASAAPSWPAWASRSRIRRRQRSSCAASRRCSRRRAAAAGRRPRREQSRTGSATPRRCWIGSGLRGLPGGHQGPPAAAREEMTRLLADLAATATPFYCPHGRPVVSRIPLREIKKDLEAYLVGPEPIAADSGRRDRGADGGGKTAVAVALGPRVAHRGGQRGLPPGVPADGHRHRQADARRAPGRCRTT